LDHPASSTRKNLLDSLSRQISECRDCRLGSTRTSAVPGIGSPDAEICFIGEGPGRDEDATGVPFVGQAGHVLDRLLLSVGLQRGGCYICNIVKCRPPNNRVPAPDEIETCSVYLYAQLAVLEPSIICLLGNTALRFFFGENYAIGQVRGTILVKDGQRFLPTYHPAAALRNPQYESVIQKDLLKLLDAIHDPGSLASRSARLQSSTNSRRTTAR
jgi:uracil-DNA glycosylase family 4